MNLEDRLYTSTEVAEILGVSLRSVYRYLEEGKIDAEVKTATGRLRFTRQNILDFLHPQDFSSRGVVKETSVVEGVKKSVSVSVPEPDIELESKPELEPEPEPVPSREETVDWLEKFRQSAKKYEGKPVDVTESEQVSGIAAVAPEEEKIPAGSELVYYRSLVGGLKDIAQNIDKVSRKASVEYAFTLNAGLSLHKPLKEPFSILHVYVQPKDKEFFEKMLQLVGSDERSAQLCLLISDDSLIYETREELHGLYVVSKNQLKKDISSFGERGLLDELE